MKIKALDYQIKVLNKIKDLKSFALFMEYGTGKSYCALAYIEKNKHKLKNGVLIVGKKTNIMEGNAWPTEIKTHTNFEFTIIQGTKKQKLEVINFPIKNRLYLINYDSIPALYKDLIARKFDMIIFDESTQIKNTSAIRTKKCMKIAETIPYRAILTGFPVSEKLDEIWSQYYTVDLGKALSDNYWKFKNKYFYRWRFGWNIKKGKDEEIINKLQDNSVFMKIKDCLDLPPRINKYISLTPTKTQIAYMNELKKDFALTIDKDTKLEYIHILPILAKLQQICSGFLYLPHYLLENTKHFETPKTETLLELMEDIPNKKIIWCKHVQEVEYLTDLLKKYKYNVVRMCSRDSDETKQENLSLFKNNHYVKTLVTTYDLLESGETLAMCNYNIMYSYTWSNNKTANAKARTYRKGSEIHDKVVYIHLYLKDTIEEVILDALRKKQSLQRKLKSYMEKWLWD